MVRNYPRDPFPNAENDLRKRRMGRCIHAAFLGRSRRRRRALDPPGTATSAVSPLAGMTGGRVGRRVSAFLAVTGLDVSLERRMVAEALVAPLVVIDAGRRLQLRGGVEVIQAPPPPVTGDALPGPVWSPRSVAGEGAIGVLKAEFCHSGNDRKP